MHRLKTLADALKISVSKFEKEVGVGSSTFTKAIQRNSEINKGIALQIKDKFPTVNIEWLLTGEGEMFIKPTKVTSTAGDGPKSVLGKIQAFLRAFDAPLAKWVAEKVDGPGLDEKDIDYLEDRIEQIKASIPGEINKMEEEFKLLKLKNKK